MESAGAGEILLTSMDRDGTRSGFDLGLTRAISDAISIPVIASGGVGSLEHLAEGVLEGHADAVRLLLKYGADRTLKDHHGLTAKEVAMKKGNDDIVALLS